MNLGKFSVDNPVLINILMVVIIVLGVVSFLKLPRELQSDVSFSWVFLSVPYPGVSAEEIEKNITIKIEDEIADVDRIKKISSITREGVSFVQIEFEDGLSDDEFRRLFQDLRAEFDKVDLPEGALDPYIDDFSTDDFMAIVSVVLSGDVETDILNKTAEKLKDKLLDIDGISKVELVGGQERKIIVDVNRDKLEAYGISIDEIVGALKAKNVNIPGGTLTTGSISYILQTLGRLNSTGSFGDVIVRRQPGKGTIRLGDIATIGSGYDESDYDVRFNGEKAITLMVSKKNTGNSISVVDQVNKIINEFKQAAPAGIKIIASNDTTIMIRDILSTLGLNSLSGFITLIIVLLVFLGLRNSLITALGIPVTFAATFLLMDWFGESLNGNSLFALVLVLGMIVDHAIVIIENCYRYKQSGLSSREAVIQGTNEVIIPVIAATGTTVAAFLPLMLLPGIMGKFMRVIPIIVSIALVLSTLEALVLLPSHMHDWGGKAKENGSLMKWLLGVLSRILTPLYRHRYLTLLGTFMVIAIAVMLTGFVKQNLFAGEDFTQFFVDIKLPIGTPRHVTETVTSRFEERLMPLVGNGEIVSLTTTVGFLQSDDEWLTQSNAAQITVDITEKKEGRMRPIKEIMKDLSTTIADIPGAESVNCRMINSGPPVDKPVSFKIRGENYDDMSSIANEFKGFLGQYPELYNIDDNYDPGSPELRIVVNEDRAAEMGLSVAQVGMFIRGAFDGVVATTYYDNDEELDVVVKFDERFRVSADEIIQIRVATPSGQMVPFSTVAHIEHGKGMGIIKRTDRKREINVTADAYDKKNLKAIMEHVQSEFGTRYATIYPEISLKVGGEYEEFNQLLTDVLQLFWIGLFMIYIILGAQFKSFIQPLLMLFALPFAIVGCILFLVIGQIPFSIVVMYAGVALAGICVNDSIVLVSFINTLRRKGTDTMTAVIEGAKIRLRPIILTSVTTIAGLLPMALGIGGKSDTWAPMAGTIIFGLIFSTMGTLFIIPCAYGILDDITKKLSFTMKLEGE